MIGRMRARVIQSNGAELFTESAGSEARRARAVRHPLRPSRHRPPPALIIHGTDDPFLPHARGAAWRASCRAQRLTQPGTGPELHPADWDVMIEAIAKHTR
jgi:pimeloyl-ACP methyl ester carboxylesterase